MAQLWLEFRKVQIIIFFDFCVLTIIPPDVELYSKNLYLPTFYIIELFLG